MKSLLILLPRLSPLLLTLILVVSSTSSLAQNTILPGAKLAEKKKPGEEPVETIPLDIDADSIEYEKQKNLMIASGHVVIKHGKETLRADFATVNLETYDTYAEGNVSYECGNDMWVGQRLKYNFRTKRGDFGKFTGFLDPFFVTAESSKQISDEEYELTDAIVTTCEGENPKAYFKVRRMRVISGRRIKGYHVTLHIKGFPVMYSPFWSQNIGERNFISLTPGYNSKMYGFLLTDFNYRFTKHLEATTSVDYRMRRGFGLGQDLLWSEGGNAKGLSTEMFSDDSDEDFWDVTDISSGFREKRDVEEDDSWYGDLITYYLHDSWPDEGEDQEYDIPNQRYRLRLFHMQTLSEKNYGMLQLNYLSDPKIIEQFFRREYRASPEPENYFVLGQRGEQYTLTLLFQGRLNDFYTYVERLPEVSFDVSRQQIGESRFYYEGNHSAVFLKKEWESAETNEPSYSAFRFDSQNMVYYPTKQFGFLNIIPRGGYEGTYYSKTKEDYTEIVETVEVDTNGVETITYSTNELARAKGAKMRSVYELGLETSFKAFKVWQTHPGKYINDLRHIVEPYADYTYIPEPNVLPDDLYQFDEIDEIDKQNDVKLGIKNKLQTRRDQRYNLINLDVWTYYRFEKEEDENQFSDIGFDLKSSPVDNLTIRIDGEYDQYDSEIKEFNTRFKITNRAWYIKAEHRYEKGDSSLLTAAVAFTPHVNWTYGAEVRYEFEDSDLEQYAFSVQRRLDCVTTRVGFEELDDDYTIWLQFWFSQFPKARVDVSM